VTELELDHLVWAAPDLKRAVADFEALTGVRPVQGGVHPDWGTANHLVGLGGGAYLEIVGPDPGRPPPGVPRPFGIDGLRSARLATWAVRTSDIRATIDAARAGGYDPGPAAEMSRLRADGVLISWRLTASGELDGLVPFLIDWGPAEHPALGLGSQLELAGLRGVHPRPPEVLSALAALGVSLPVAEGSRPSLAATLRGPRGEVVLR
jgi:hypothetical protein